MERDCSFDSSEGAFPNGYSIWAVYSDTIPSLISCHCDDDHVPGEGPISVDPEYEGQRIKWPCDIPR